MPAWINETPTQWPHRLGYFENEHGEQWVVLIEPHRIRLAGGDIGWDDCREKDRPTWNNLLRWLPHWPAGLILNEPERAWLTLTIKTAASIMEFALTETATAVARPAEQSGQGS
jgi:hypothetical protein